MESEACWDQGRKEPKQTPSPTIPSSQVWCLSGVHLPAVEKAQDPAQLPWSSGSWIIPAHLWAALKCEGNTSLASMFICESKEEMRTGGIIGQRDQKANCLSFKGLYRRTLVRLGSELTHFGRRRETQAERFFSIFLLWHSSF